MTEDVKLMTRDEFNGAVKAWSQSVKDKSLSVLVSETKSYSGRLQGRLKSVLGLDRKTAEAESVAFKFMRYGVFVAYGVGRGYVSVNGTVIRGHKLKANSAGDLMLSRRGMTKRELSKVKIAGEGTINRHPVDWLDSNLEKNIEGLAEIAGEYYGDKTMQHTIDQLDRLTIKR